MSARDTIPSLRSPPVSHDPFTRHAEAIAITRASCVARHMLLPRARGGAERCWPLTRPPPGRAVSEQHGGRADGWERGVGAERIRRAKYLGRVAPSVPGAPRDELYGRRWTGAERADVE